MASDDRYRKIDLIHDADGEPVEVGVLDDRVIIAVGRSGEAHLSSGARDRFMRAYMDAERQAEAAGRPDGASGTEAG